MCVYDYFDLTFKSFNLRHSSYSATGTGIELGPGYERKLEATHYQNVDFERYQML